MIVATAASAPPTWSGRWQAEPYGLRGNLSFTLKQTASIVTGAFKWQFEAEHGLGGSACRTGTGGTIKGTVRGRTLKGTLVYPPGQGHPRGTTTLEATLSANGRAISAGGVMQSGECHGINFSFDAVRIGPLG